MIFQLSPLCVFVQALLHLGSLLGLKSPRCRLFITSLSSRGAFQTGDIAGSAALLTPVLKTLARERTKGEAADRELEHAALRLAWDLGRDPRLTPHKDRLSFVTQAFLAAPARWLEPLAGPHRWVVLKWWEGSEPGGSVLTLL
jgi:hypothetical protein